MLNYENKLTDLIKYQKVLIENEKLLWRDLESRRKKEFTVMNQTELLQNKIKDDIEKVVSKLNLLEVELRKVKINIFEYQAKRPFLQGQISHSSLYIKILEYNIEKLTEEEIVGSIAVMQAQIEEQKSLINIVNEQYENEKVKLESLLQEAASLKKTIEDNQKLLIDLKEKLINLYDIFTKAEVSYLELAVLAFGSERKLESLEKVMKECKAENIKRNSVKKEHVSGINVNIQQLESDIVRISLGTINLNSSEEQSPINALALSNEKEKAGTGPNKKERANEESLSK